MSDCLVTKLKGVVNDDSIPYFGELHIKFEPTTTGQEFPKFSLSTAYGFTAAVVGEGNLLDSEGSVIGKKNNYPSGDGMTVSVDGDVSEIFVAPLYGITKIDGYGNVWNKVYGTNSTKDISRLTKLTYIKTRRYCGLTVEGDISYVAGLKNLETLSITDEDRFVGDIAVLSNLENLKIVSFSGCYGTHGAISCFSNMSNLTDINLGFSNSYYGDLSDVGPNVKWINSDKRNVFTWVKGRSTSRPIINMTLVNLGTYVDAALINLSNCQNWETTKTISLFGTRTSASDEAVAKLQDMGWTVTVSEA